MKCAVCGERYSQPYHRGGYVCPNGHWNDPYKPEHLWTLPPKIEMERKEILAGIRNRDGSLKNPTRLQRLWEFVRHLW